MNSLHADFSTNRFLKNSEILFRKSEAKEKRRFEGEKRLRSVISKERNDREATNQLFTSLRSAQNDRMLSALSF
jgi:hypothetical protein